ncbi:MAG: polysaccharide pyruvyl transferase family protein [Pirellulales bacterium]
MNKPAVIIRGAYGESNFGDDVLMLISCDVVRRACPEHEVILLFVSRVPESGYRYVQRMLPGLRIIHLESEAAADLVVWGGGTQFYSFAATNVEVSKLTKIMRALFNPAKFMHYAKRLMYGNKFAADQRFAALGVGIGPFVPGSSAESYSRRLFSGMDYIAVRDPASIELCNAWGCHGAQLRSDLAFLTDSWLGSIQLPDAVPGSVAIVVRDWPHSAAGTELERSALKLADQLRSQGRNVAFVLFRSSGDDRWEQILGERGEREILRWDPEQSSVHGFLAELAKYETWVTARYHGAIFGAIIGRNVIPVELEPKLTMVAELLNSPLWQSPFDADAAMKMIDASRSEEFDSNSNRTAAVEGQKQAARQMIDEFSRFCRSESQARQ